MGSGSGCAGNNKGIETVVSDHPSAPVDQSTRTSKNGGRMATAKVTDADEGDWNKLNCEALN
ncbi:MAG: hypothetical protein DMF74_00165 [Acidobacteria bacterium]|nr:MAG: hypothetical protein DMF74_00165 [Acidobacteriota bacterium]